MNPTTKLHNRLYLFLAKGSLWGALVVGAVSMWSFGVMSIVLRFMSGHALPNEASRLVEAVIIPQSAASLLALGIAFISSRLLGAKTGMSQYLRASGYFALVSPLLSTMVGMMAALAPAAKTGTPILMVVLAMNLLCIAGAVYGLLFSLHAIRHAFGFGLTKALVFAVLVALPSLYVGVAVVPLTDAEIQAAGMTVDTAGAVRRAP